MRTRAQHLDSIPAKEMATEASGARRDSRRNQKINFDNAAPIC
jgi:hypothetical protein